MGGLSRDFSPHSKLLDFNRFRFLFLWNDTFKFDTQHSIHKCRTLYEHIFSKTKCLFESSCRYTSLDVLFIIITFWTRFRVYCKSILFCLNLNIVLRKTSNCNFNYILFIRCLYDILRGIVCCGNKTLVKESVEHSIKTDRISFDPIERVLYCVYAYHSFLLY